MPSLTAAFTSPEAKRQHVRRLFATIADRYDLVTRVLSYGMDARWKARLSQAVAPRAGERALDLACGTGDIAYRLAGSGAQVCGLDITPRMLQLARAKTTPARCRWTAGDMTALPFADGSFDVVTTGYGLRNVPDLDAAVAEIARVLRPGGRFASLDFNRPESPLVRWPTSAISSSSAARSAGRCTARPLPIAISPRRSGGIRAPAASPIGSSGPGCAMCRSARCSAASCRCTSRRVLHEPDCYRCQAQGPKQQ